MLLQLRGGTGFRLILRLLPYPPLWTIAIAAGLSFTTHTDLVLAQSFSADLATTGKAGEISPQHGRLVVDKDKVRIETPAIPDSFFVIDLTERTSYLVRPAQKVFMDAKQSTPLTQFLVPVDPADPCLRWRATAEIAGALNGNGTWRCERLGEESLAGHATVKYKIVSPRGRIIQAWVDPQLKFPVKIRNEDETGVVVQAIEEGLQDANLFKFPASYAKFDPKQLIERMKQSDVWVEPPR